MPELLDLNMYDGVWAKSIAYVRNLKPELQHHPFLVWENIYEDVHKCKIIFYPTSSNNNIYNTASSSLGQYTYRHTALPTLEFEDKGVLLLFLLRVS